MTRILCAAEPEGSCQATEQLLEAASDRDVHYAIASLRSHEVQLEELPVKGAV